jgi:hypothetical protein
MVECNEKTIMEKGQASAEPQDGVVEEVGTEAIILRRNSLLAASLGV